MARPDHPTPSGANIEDPIFQAGVQHGREERQVEVLGWLQNRYLRPDAPARDSVEGQAILKLTRELSGFMKSTK